MIVTLVGHRGAAGLAPENTLPAFRAAIAAGVRILETDVRLTRDGRLICFHDDRLDRLAPAQGLVSERDWSELRDLPILPGSFGGAFPQARIPLLEEVLRAVPDACRFCIEIKADPGRPGEVAAAALRCLKDAGALARTRVIAFDVNDLRAVRTLAASDPSLEPAEFGVLASRTDFDHWQETAGELQATTLHCNYRLLVEHPSLAAEAHALGYRVNAWTVNDAEAAKALAHLGIEEITTDDPVSLGVLGGRETSPNT